MTKLIFGTEAREKILEGARKGAFTVIPTLGPAGRNVAVHKEPILHDGKIYHTAPMITKDGVSALNSVASFDCPWEDTGLQMLKEAARNTNKTGDGTTTSALLAYEMMKGGMELLAEGANAIHVRRGMDRACEAICESLENSAKKIDGIEELTSIARISSQDDELASVVANSIQEVGKDGAVTMQAGISQKTYYEVTNGMQVEVGFASHYFARNGQAELKNAFIIVTTEKIASIRDISGILQLIRNQMNKEEETKDEPIRIAIFSTGVSGDALKTLAKNNQERSDYIQSIVFNPPSFGGRQKEVLEDIALATGATLIDKTAGLSVAEMGIINLGVCDLILASDRMTTIVGSYGSTDAVEKRIGMIRAQLDNAEDDDKDYFKSRIAGLEGKFASIYVGGNSEFEQKEKLHRVEDAIAATKAAFEGGILPGGGVALIAAKEAIEGLSGNDGELKGIGIVKDVLSKQLWWVAENAGEDPEEVIKRVSFGHHEDIEKGVNEWTGKNAGFNAETHEYGDMFDMKVIDPAQVPIAALKNAVSVAGSFLTIESAVDNG